MVYWRTQGSPLRLDTLPLASPLASSSKECASPLWSSAAMWPSFLCAHKSTELHYSDSRLRYWLPTPLVMSAHPSERGSRLLSYPTIGPVPYVTGATIADSCLLLQPLGRTSENSPSRHFGE